MPVIGPEQTLKKRMPIIYIYGDPGSSKSSIINTSEQPILIDFDRGADRTILRKMVLQPDDWEEVKRLEKAGEFQKYKTVGIDTAKGALDDFIQPWVVNQDPKYGSMKWQLQLYGQMGKEFKRFVNSLRMQNCAIIVVAHARKEDDGKMVPDVTGGSAAFLLRLADQVGYISIKKGKRVIQFEPTEDTYGKNCANLPLIEVPHKDSEEFKEFGAKLVSQVFNALNSMTIEQEQVLAKMEEYGDRIHSCETPDEMNELLKEVNQLPDYMRLPLRNQIAEYVKSKSWKASKDRGYYMDEKVVKEQPTAKNPTDDAANKSDVAEKKEEAQASIYEKVYETIEELAAAIEMATDLTQLASVHFNNEQLIASDKKIAELFDNKKKSIHVAA